MSSVPWFETPLMNAVQRDLAGWPSEKLSERSALLRLNDARRHLLQRVRSGCLWPAFTAASLSSRGR